MEQEIGVDTSEVGTDEFFSGKYQNCAYSCFQNRSLEDRFIIASKGDVKYYGIYDGHGESLQYRKDKTLSSNHVVLHIRDKLHHYVFDCLGSDPLSLRPDEINTRIRALFTTVDSHMMNVGGQFGCTTNIILVIGNYVYQINLGDSKSILYRDDYIISETRDHEPNNEKERIAAAGGRVSDDNRVNGILAMSRAFGNYHLKVVNGSYSPDGPVSCRPNVTVTSKQQGMKFIIASDGLYDGLTSTQYLINILSKSNDHLEAVRNLTYLVQGNNSDDDTTMISGDIV